MKCYSRFVLGATATAVLCQCSAYRASVDAVSSAASAVGSVASKAVDVVTPGSKDETPKADWNDAVVTVDLNGVAQQFVIHLRPDLAPKHVANFKSEVNSGTYSGLAVHRAIRSYLVQMGDPLTKDESAKADWGTGGNAKKVPSEVKGKHRRASVAMARLSDDVNPSKLSSATQFYVMLKNAPSLDKDYTVFGEVTSGLDVVERVAATSVDTNDVPTSRVNLSSIKLVAPSAAADVAKRPNRGTATPESEKGTVTKFIERIW
jgi:cyclophilin family peptidyl-prolyl cis-trans isomerase